MPWFSRATARELGLSPRSCPSKASLPRDLLPNLLARQPAQAHNLGLVVLFLGTERIDLMRILSCAFLARLAFVALLIHSTSSYADTFGSGANTFAIEFVAIGDPGNLADTTGNPNPAGAVPYTYRIGKYEVSEQMIDKANALGGIGLTKDTRGPDKPATSIGWFEAARFVNWLNDITGNTPAYKFDSGGNFQLWNSTDNGYDANNLYRNRLARYFLPSVDEWYKAAFYDPNSGVYFEYPTGSDNVPASVASGTAAGTAVYGFQTGPADVKFAGGLSPYGTMAQGGNVFEFQEGDFGDIDFNSPYRGLRGTGWNTAFSHMRSPGRTFIADPANGLDFQGFRIASIIPEPNAVILFGIGLTVFLRRL
jgi:sulfatase modifying factor 1